MLFGAFEKPQLENHATMKPAAVMVKMFVDGWAAFLDDKTKFDPRILLAIGKQAYVDGDFVITGVDYTLNSDNTIHRDKELVLYRRLMINETMTRMLICMIGIPHVAVGEKKLNAASPYYAHVEALVGGIKIMHDF